uniref:Ig-like domain-containing protein n=1 Tax=Meloidogyne hapla TaxID=6305 RepID=A0A1I8B0B9_MELHA
MSILGEIEILDDGTILIEKREFLSKLQKNSQKLINENKLKNRGYSPRFTYTPRDRRYREGTAVQLNCEAIGDPKPKIYWFFNSQQIESSRKHTFHNEGTQLLIYPFLEQDIGIYNCEAVNINGRNKSLNARLEIIKSYPPEIIEGPKSKNVNPGQKIIFRCKAKGEPKPSIGWFFNGIEISSFGGHFQSQLTIGPISRRDAGIYSCMAGNTVGSMTSDAQLEITSSSQLNEIDKQLNNQKTFLKDIVNKATNNIERAIIKTKEELKINSPKDLLKHFKFIGKQQPTELSKSREIYEESLRLIEKHVELGINLKPQEMPTENISFESVLSVTHIQTLMELSGCMSGQFKDTCQDMCFHSKYRSYTGQCNNFDHPTWGVSQMPFLRLLPPIYENGFNTPVGWNKDYLYFGYPKPNPRTVSVELIGAENISPHPFYSAMLMQWGQFLDHDLDFTATALSRQTYVGGARCNRTCENVSPCFNIPLPANDYRLLAIANSSDKLPCIEFERSAAICGSGETSPIFQQITYREQANIITSYLDGSQVYGSTEVDALDLRDLFSDHGLLRFDIVSSAQKPYLPFERDSAMDCRRNFSKENPIRCFLSGDFRANEQIGLTAMHTIWMREHNLIATQLLEMNSDWDGERIYQEHITYKEWLPKVLGMEGYKALIGPYNGYSTEVNPSVSNAFATAAFRFGHTLINPKLERLDKNFNSIQEGPLPLHEAFFAPERLLAEGGVDPLLRGLFASPLKQPMSEQLLNRELTERLFHRAHNVSLDLAAINIQRGRDHGLPGYLEYRRFCGLTVPTNWEQLSFDIPNPEVLARLKKLYGHPGNIDLWVGGIVERRLPEALVGPTFSCIIGDQFKRLREGDRFWYENPGVFTHLQLTQIRKSTLAGIICRNGDDIDKIQPDVFLYFGQNKLAYKKCEQLPKLNLRMWMSCSDESCSFRSTQNNGKNEEEILQEIKRRKRRSKRLYN